MIYTPHLCNRPCKHNCDGTCVFFVGDMYYFDCMDNATMFQPRD